MDCIVIGRALIIGALLELRILGVARWLAFSAACYVSLCCNNSVN